MGPTISGEANGDWFGRHVALSADGNHMIVGAPYNDGSGNQAGHARVFQWNGSTWQQVGDDIDSLSASDWAHAVDINSNGTVVVLGSKGADYNQGFDRDGVVRVFDLIDEAWVSRPSLSGEESLAYFGQSVSLSASGDTLAVGADYPRDKSWQAGRVYTYDWEGTYWNLRTQHDGSVAQTHISGGKMGTSLAIK